MSVHQILIGRNTVRSGKKNFKLLICGDINIPPPMGGLARRIINHSKVLCNMGVDIHLLSVFRKEKIDLSEVPFKIHYLLDVKAKETKKVIFQFSLLPYLNNSFLFCFIQFLH
ncbi:MAG: hypothetical protein ACTSVW_05450 [Candidatus Njordarchaeales archaeon]